METIVLRAYVDSEMKERFPKEEKSNNRVLIVDTETTNDIYLNFKFGFFRIYVDGLLQHIGIIYNPVCDDEELLVLKSFCKRNGIQLYTSEEFVTEVFYPEVYYLGTLCIGFNLPFDISRLAIKYNSGRRKNKGSFTFRLTDNKKFPYIRIKHGDSTLSFIGFAQGLTYDGRKSSFKGNFLDLKTLVFALTNEEHSLKSACELYGTTQKTEIEFGRTTEKVIEYNLNDVQITYELFLKLKREFERYQLDLPMTKTYSPASLGKACLDKMGIKTFREKNPNFPKITLGKLMTAYYGGRSEVRIRKVPTNVTLIDFKSMYPTVFALQDLWSFLIADKIEFADCTDEIRDLARNIKLEDLQKPELWKRLNVLVEIDPNDDLLPVRMKYDKDVDADIYNIGINYFTFNGRMYFVLADILPTILLTGKVPEIISAIRFVPVGVQKGLKEAEILGMKINPAKENFFQRLIEKRNEIQNRMKILDQNSQEYRILDSQQNILKIIANSSSYGIFIQIDLENEENKIVDVYGLDGRFQTEISKIEKQGKYFNPIVGVMIPASARLILAITESIVSKHDKCYAFCDTDSMAVPPELVKEIQEFFEPLNPYSFDEPLFKIEKSRMKGLEDIELENVLCYGISAKRYVLYRKSSRDFIIYKYSLHGLGHLTNPYGEEESDWQKRVWMDILKLEYGILSEEDFIENYSDLFAIMKMTVSTPHILKIFNRLNAKKPYDKMLKPFNFFLVGKGTVKIGKKIVKPIASYTKNPQSVVHGDFIDANSKKTLNDLKYWKQLSDLLWKYVHHKESKFDGDTGILQRKHMISDKNNVLYIGKETSNLDNALEKLDYVRYNNLNKLKILKLKYTEVKDIVKNRQALYHIKKQLKSGKRLHKSTMDKIREIVEYTE